MTTLPRIRSSSAAGAVSKVCLTIFCKLHRLKLPFQITTVSAGADAGFQHHRASRRSAAANVFDGSGADSISRMHKRSGSVAFGAMPKVYYPLKL